MTEQEELFLKSIQYKIEHYDIHNYKTKKKLTVRDCLPYARNKFVKAHYNDGSPDEIIDIGIESFLYKCSPLLFLEKYAQFELPGVGKLGCKNLYYFQKEILKDFNNWKKIVATKTRQCLTEDNYVYTDRGYISIKNVKIGDKIQTIKDGKLYYTEVLNFINQGKKQVCKIMTVSGDIIKCTLDHKVLTKDGWKEAKDLTIKDELVSYKEKVIYPKIKKIEILDGEENVYDITTETHDFLANNLVVHNCGMSTLTSLIFFWKAVLFPNEWLVVISKDGKSAQDFLDKIKTNLENIPEWFGLKVTKNNVKGVAFSNKTKIDAFSRSKSAGRGTSPTMVILDEAAFYLTNSIIEGIVSSVMPSLSRTGGQLFVVSTPNGSAEGSEGYWYYNQVRQLQEAGGTEGLARLYDVAWWEVLDYPGITPYKGYNDKVQTYIDRDYFNHPEVKKEAYAFFDPIAKNDWKNNEWLSYQMSTAGKVKYMQEILQNFVVTGNTVFSDEIISKVNNETKVPLTKDMLEDRPLKGLWIWKKPLIDHKYILSCDVAKGSSDDSSCLQVLDMSTYEQVAEYSGKCTTIDLANYAYKLGEYYNWAFEVIECNSIGEATFSELYYNLNYPNLFKQKKVKQGVEVMTGWITSTKSRDLITDKFIDFYYDDVMWKNYHPFSERLLDQMKYWIWKGGRPDHAGNAHDDNIMAMAIGLFNISEGIKRIRGEDDTFFIDENGNNITMKDNSNTKLTDEFLSTKKEGEKVNDYVYRSMERKMYQQAGINPADEDAAETLKWLMS